MASVAVDVGLAMSAAMSWLVLRDHAVSVLVALVLAARLLAYPIGFAVQLGIVWGTPLLCLAAYAHAGTRAKWVETCRAHITTYAARWLPYPLCLAVDTVMDSLGTMPALALRVTSAIGLGPAVDMVACGVHAVLCKYAPATAGTSKPCPDKRNDALRTRKGKEVVRDDEGDLQTHHDD